MGEVKTKRINAKRTGLALRRSPEPPQGAAEVLGPEFSVGSYVVYPAHGLGVVQSVEETQVGRHSVRAICVRFERERLVVRVPLDRIEKKGLRPLATRKRLEVAYRALGTQVRARGGIWARRAQEYEAKIHSGCVVRLAEVLRELYRGESQPVSSFSERQLYQLALDRLAGEVSVVERITPEAAAERVQTYLRVKLVSSHTPRRTTSRSPESLTESLTGETDLGQLAEAPMPPVPDRRAGSHLVEEAAGASL